MKTQRIPKSPRLKVEVTQERIDHAITRDSRHCMIAEAIRAAVPEAKSISVDLATIRFTDPRRGLRYTYLTPRIAQVSLVQFDRRKKPAPFEFNLRQGHVAYAGSTATRKEKHREAGTTARTGSTEGRRKGGKRGAEALRKTRLVTRNGKANPKGDVLDRVGGKAAPLQSVADDVPFTRRRAFGVRALEF